MLKKSMNSILVRCTNLDREELVPQGISLLNLAKQYEQELGFRAINCRVNNNTVSLLERVYEPATLHFVDISDESGMRTYIRTLSFIVSKAVFDVLPGSKFFVEHSLANGYYCSIKRNTPITDEDLEHLLERINQLIQADLPFIPRTISSEKAIELFRSIGESDKSDLIETAQLPYTTYWELDGYPDTYYGSLAPSTGYIYLYGLERHLDGFLLRIPNRNDPHFLAPITTQPKMRHVIQEQEHLLGMLELEHIGSLNKAIKRDEIADIIHISEAMQEKGIAKIAQEIAHRYTQGVRIILISGPSSSGKTTFTKRLCTQLRTCYLKPHMLSMDDFFVDREKTPLDEKGEYDFESLYALDLELFNKDLAALLAGKEVEIPTFDFKTGHRVYTGHSLTLKEGDVLLIEGIHALNSNLLPTFPQEALFRVYVSALTTIGLDAHNRVPTTDNRLLRRMVRDYRYRGYSAIETLKRWSSVRKGEDKWVFPFQENADAMFNSAMVYELAALRSFAEPLLWEVPPMVPEYSEAQRLLRFLRMINYIQIDKLPGTSLLREFLGGSTFRY